MYKLIIPVVGYSAVSKILEQLYNRFGEQYTEETKINRGYAQNFIRRWNKQKEKVEFNLYFPRNNQLEDDYYEFENIKDTSSAEPKMDSAKVFIDVTYLPLIKEIEAEIEKEESP